MREVSRGAVISHSNLCRYLRGNHQPQPPCRESGAGLGIHRELSRRVTTCPHLPPQQSSFPTTSLASLPDKLSLTGYFPPGAQLHISQRPSGITLGTSGIRQKYLPYSIYLIPICILKQTYFLSIVSFTSTTHEERLQPVLTSRCPVPITNVGVMANPPPIGERAFNLSYNLFCRAALLPTFPSFYALCLIPCSLPPFGNHPAYGSGPRVLVYYSLTSYTHTLTSLSHNSPRRRHGLPQGRIRRPELPRTPIPLHCRPAHTTVRGARIRDRWHSHQGHHVWR